jgi:hypothetical protein
MTLDFDTIFNRELDVINFRRRTLQNGAVEVNRSAYRPAISRGLSRRSGFGFAQCSPISGSAP